MGVASIIVMEPGGPWPGHVGDSDSVVAVRHDAEGLLGRTRRVVESLRERHQRVRVAVLACNDSTDAASNGRRDAIASELLRAVARITRGHLVLCATESASTDLRHELVSLAGRLSQDLAGTMATISLRFGVRCEEEPC